MSGSNWFDCLLFGFAKAAEKAAARPGDDGGMSSMIYLLPVIGVLFYLMILRPQNSADKARKERLSKLKKNDKVVTNAGIFGTIVNVDTEGQKVVLRVDDDRNVRLTLRIGSITEIIDPNSAKEKGDSKEKDKEKTAETVQ